MSLSTPTEQQAHDEKIAALSFEKAKAKAQFDRQVRNRDSSDDRYLRASYNEAEVELERLGRELASLHEAYTGWPRYYHVQNANGHVHTSTSCSTCFPDTIFSWRTDLSGLSAEQVVEREAYRACSVCLPIAPAEQKAARVRYDAEQREARKAEKDAKAAEKLAKAALRAQKLIVKAEATMAKMTPEGTREAFLSAYSEHGHDGKRSTYRWCMDNEIQTTVEDVLMDMQKRANGQRGWNKDPYQIVAEAREKGLID
jgi:hypothetical protein